VTEPEFKELKATRSLAWQDDEDATDEVKKEETESEGGFENTTVCLLSFSLPLLLSFPSLERKNGGRDF
jgi:hypothetical protein